MGLTYCKRITYSNVENHLKIHMYVLFNYCFLLSSRDTIPLTPVKLFPSVTWTEKLCGRTFEQFILISFDQQIGFTVHRFNILNMNFIRILKGIDRSFELRCEIRLNRFVMTNWRLGYFFYFILKGQHHKISQKPIDAA